ncbi:hypothetical protein [Chitinophaga barathri]|uniref:Type II toxin-antitoxin system HicB family antitoxin n=1 Tax=Chitinophaga barathri TaxID=1647451 RepID=A0A3N4MBF0_9BACT|nr:hypothetical protein [Chitinophaga barathri]RPD38747.1 hypothetical protein EG028_23870 [Chitinophaga barathri]
MERFSFDLPAKDYCPVKIQGYTFEDDQGCFHAHLPGLDLTGYGASRREAKDCLEVVLRAYFKDMLEKGLLEEDLAVRGWTFGDELIWPPLDDNTGLEDMLELIKSGSPVRGFTCTLDMPQPQAYVS